MKPKSVANISHHTTVCTRISSFLSLKWFSNNKNRVKARDRDVFPNDVAKHFALAKYGLEYYDVSRRIVRINKRSHFEVGELSFEKRWSSMGSDKVRF
jgi:hypothetical protein